MASAPSSCRGGTSGRSFDTLSAEKGGKPEGSHGDWMEKSAKIWGLLGGYLGIFEESAAGNAAEAGKFSEADCGRLDSKGFQWIPRSSASSLRGGSPIRLDLFFARIIFQTQQLVGIVQVVVLMANNVCAMMLQCHMVAKMYTH